MEGRDSRLVVKKNTCICCKSIIIYKIEKKYIFLSSPYIYKRDNKSKMDNGKEEREIDGERKINERIVFLWDDSNTMREGAFYRHRNDFIHSYIK